MACAAWDCEGLCSYEYHVTFVHHHSITHSLITMWLLKVWTQYLQLPRPSSPCHNDQHKFAMSQQANCAANFRRTLFPARFLLSHIESVWAWIKDRTSLSSAFYLCRAFLTETLLSFYSTYWEKTSYAVGVCSANNASQAICHTQTMLSSWKLNIYTIINYVLEHKLVAWCSLAKNIYK